MSNEVIEVIAEEFGIEKTKAVQVAKSFDVVLEEGKAIIEDYNELMKLENEELTKDDVKKISTLRKKAKKINANTEKIRKSEKAYHIASGKYIQALADKAKTNVTIMIDNLTEKENYAELKEVKRISDLTIVREKELESFELEVIPPNLGSVDDATWEAMKLGYKASQDAKIEAERVEQERIEKERLEAEEKEKERLRVEELEKDRRFKTSRLVEYIEGYDTIVFAELSEEDFEKICKSAIDARAKYEAEQEAIRVENEKLKQEAKEKEVEIEKAKKLHDERYCEITPYWDYVPFENRNMDFSKLTETEWKKRFEYSKKEKEKADKKEADEQLERERLQKEENDKKIKLVKEAKEARSEADRILEEQLVKENKRIQEEINRIKQEEADKQAELNKGDSDKVKDLISDLEALKTKYTFKSAKNKKMFNGVIDLLTKVVGFINK